MDVEALRAAARAGELSEEGGELAAPASEAEKWMEAFKALAVGMGVVVDAVVEAMDKAYDDIEQAAGRARPNPPRAKGDGAAKLVDLISEAVIIGVIDQVDNETTRASLKRMVSAVDMGGEDEIVTAATSPRPTPEEVKALADVAAATGLTMEEATRSFTTLAESRAKPRSPRPPPKERRDKLSKKAMLFADGGYLLAESQKLEFTTGLAEVDKVRFEFAAWSPGTAWSHLAGEIKCIWDDHTWKLLGPEYNKLVNAFKDGESFELEFELTSGF